MVAYASQIFDILEAGRVHLSTIKPSDWTEQNMIMQKPFPGPFSYSRTPYTREIIDCLAPDHPAKIIAVMKGAQIGFSAGVIYPGIGWIIKNQPGNTYLMVGAPDLIEKSMEKVDLMIDSTAIRRLIKPQVLRNRAGKSGDTNFKKEFPGGYLTVGSANNHKGVRQVDLQYGFFDDFEAFKKASEQSGSTRKLLEQRFAAYADKSKIFYISTPELEKGSNIKPAYLLGDQRRYMVPCPCCGEFISFEWSMPIEGTNQMAGIYYELDNHQRLVPSSVGYICQNCGGFFNDRNKDKLLNQGYWKPTATPSREGYYSYQISALYAPAGMYDWKHYAGEYLEAHPPGEDRKEELVQTFVNLCLGETYEPESQSIKANQLQKNIRAYEVGEVPEKMSIRDGNGKIVMLTCAIDMGGKVEDGRLDYEVVAWSETGSRYSIMQGNIGTFIPMENSMKFKVDRARWTYEQYKENSVWPELDKILAMEFMTDTGRTMSIAMSVLDTGHYTTYAYAYLDSSNFNIVGIKGKDSAEYVKINKDASIYSVARERNNLFLLEVHLIKDRIAEYINLKYDQYNDVSQPAGFMNFPTPSGGQYLYDSYFAHYEAENKEYEIKDGQGIAFRWKKKSPTHQNHFFDVAVYNYAARELFVFQWAKQLKQPRLTYLEFATYLAQLI